MSEKDRIKTAVELALERTVGKRASREEMQAIQEKERRERARGIVSRYLKREKTLKEFSKELDELDNSESGPLRSMVFEELLSSIELGADYTTAVDALAAMAKEEASEDIGNLKALLRDFDNHKAHAKEKLASARLDELKERGIRGTGVTPNLRADKQWHEISEKLQSAYKPKLEGLLADLLEKAV